MIETLFAPVIAAMPPILNASSNYVQSANEQVTDTTNLLQARQEITENLQLNPYDLILYLQRASIHTVLGYPDLAAGDSYRALILCDEISNASFEYHDQAWNTLSDHCTDGIPGFLQGQNIKLPSDIASRFTSLSVEDNYMTQKLLETLHIASVQCYRSLSASLRLCHCLKSAFENCARGQALAPDDEELLKTKKLIERDAMAAAPDNKFDIKSLPDEGLVRRELYPWNNYEPDRFSPSSLASLNHQLAVIAPKCEVRVTELPNLAPHAIDATRSHPHPSNSQLGLFAKEDILPGEMVLTELSVLTANNCFKEPLCDACSAKLPPLSAVNDIVDCSECEDISFCNQICLTRALEEYHPAVCGKDVDTIAKDPNPIEKPFALYFLLLCRSIAMASTQGLHPLNLKEVKYIWGDFSRPETSPLIPLISSYEAPCTLPFSFKYSIVEPLHFLEKLDIDIFADVANYDQWVLNTLYSKFRGTASACVNPRTGHPEVAAVHPLWCLANHDCDPNVEWQWQGHMNMRCRKARIGGCIGGISADMEILNHYCDIELGVRQRREWAHGSLGGWCQCKRCRDESVGTEPCVE